MLPAEELEEIINSHNLAGYTPLHVAITHRYFDLAEWMTKNGANTKAKDFLGYAPLEIAEMLRVDPKFIQLLKQYGVFLKMRR